MTEPSQAPAAPGLTVFKAQKQLAWDLEVTPSLVTRAVLVGSSRDGHPAGGSSLRRVGLVVTGAVPALPGDSTPLEVEGLPESVQSLEEVAHPSGRPRCWDGRVW